MLPEKPQFEGRNDIEQSTENPSGSKPFDLAKSRGAVEKEGLEDIKRQKQDIRSDIDKHMRKIDNNKRKITELNEILDNDERRQQIEKSQRYKKFQDLNSCISQALSDTAVRQSLDPPERGEPQEIQEVNPSDNRDKSDTAHLLNLATRFVVLLEKAIPITNYKRYRQVEMFFQHIVKMRNNPESQKQSANELLNNIWKYSEKVFNGRKLQNENLELEQVSRQLKTKIIQSLNAEAGVKLTENDPECRIAWKISNARKMLDNLNNENEQLAQNIEDEQREFIRLDHQQTLINFKPLFENVPKGTGDEVVEGAVLAIRRMSHVNWETLSTPQLGSKPTIEEQRQEISEISKRIENLESLGKNIKAISGKEQSRDVKRQIGGSNTQEEEVTSLLNRNIPRDLLNSAWKDGNLKKKEPVQQVMRMIEIAGNSSRYIDPEYQKHINGQTQFFLDIIDGFIQHKAILDNKKPIIDVNTINDLRHLENRNINIALDLVTKEIPRESRSFELQLGYDINRQVIMYINYFTKNTDVSDLNKKHLDTVINELTKRNSEILLSLLVDQSNKASEILQDVWKKYPNRRQPITDGIKRNEEADPNANIIQKINEIAHQDYPVKNLPIDKVRQVFNAALSTLKQRKEVLQSHMENSVEFKVSKAWESIDKIKRKINDLENDKKSLQTSTKNKTKRIQDLEDKVEKLDKIIKANNKGISLKDTKILELNRELAKKEKNTTNQEKRIQDLKKRIQDLEEQTAQLQEQHKRNTKQRLAELKTEHEQNTKQRLAEQAKNLQEQHEQNTKQRLAEQAKNLQEQHEQNTKQRLAEQAKNLQEQHEQNTKQRLAELKTEHEQNTKQRLAEQAKNLQEQHTRNTEQRLAELKTEHDEKHQQALAEQDARHQQALAEQDARHQQALAEQAKNLLAQNQEKFNQTLADMVDQHKEQAGQIARLKKQLELDKMDHERHLQNALNTYDPFSFMPRNEGEPQTGANSKPGTLAGLLHEIDAVRLGPPNTPNPARKRADSDILSWDSDQPPLGTEKDNDQERLRRRNTLPKIVPPFE